MRARVTRAKMQLPGAVHTETLLTLKPLFLSTPATGAASDRKGQQHASIHESLFKVRGTDSNSSTRKLHHYWQINVIYLRMAVHCASSSTPATQNICSRLISDLQSKSPLNFRG